MPMSESTLQMQLAKDPVWLQRLTYLMIQEARIIKAEGLRTPYHAERTKYASTVLSNAAMAAQQASSVIVGGPNILGTVDLADNGITTSATDAAILDQVSLFWNTLAGIDTGPA